MIHKFRLNNLNIVIDVNSGAIHIVDDVFYEVIDVYAGATLKEVLNKLENKFDHLEIEEAYFETSKLVNDSVLFSKDYHIDVLPTIKNRNPVVKALCLHIAHDCNLKCKYCFAEEGEYGGKRELMSFEVGKAALDYVVKNSGNRRNIEIDFFGGEPLMNFDVVKQIVSYGRELEKIHDKIFRFTLTTNGLLLNDEIIEYINKNMHNIVISLDGRKEINDLMRPNMRNGGSYDIIVPKFKKLAEARNQDNYYIRGTFTKNNLDFYEDVIHMADLGFKQISIEPVVSETEEDYSISEVDLKKIYTEYEKLAIELCKRRKDGVDDFNFFHFNVDLTGGPCMAKRVVGCGAGTEYLAVTPSGELFPCHQFVGDDEFKIGNVFDGVLNTTCISKFDDCNIFNKDDCKDCWCKYFCSGGCAANGHSINKDILKPYAIACEMQKKRVECGIMLKAMELLDYEDFDA